MVALGKHAVHTLFQERQHILDFLEVGLARLHLSAQVGAGVKPVAVLFAVKVMQAIAQPLDHVFIGAHRLPRLGSAQQNAFHANAPNRLCGVRWRTAQKHRARHAPGRLHAAKAGVMAINIGGGGAWAIHLALNHGFPAIGQVVNALVAHHRIVQRQRAGHDERILVVAVPQPVDDDGQVLQHPARALEFVQRGPVLVQPVEHLGVDGVGLGNALLVTRLLCLSRELAGVLAVQLAKGPCGGLYLHRIARRVKQAAAHNFKRLLRSHRLPHRLHPAKVLFQHRQGTLALGACSLGF